MLQGVGKALALFLTPLVMLGCGGEKTDRDLHDVLIRGGLVYDGSGEPPRVADVAIDGDQVTAIGELSGQGGRVEIDAAGLAVSPGFINMLSWANESLLHDGRSLSDLHQGVTLEVMGEGASMGPWTEAMKERDRQRQGDIRYDISWTTLGEYLEHLETRGVSTNVASFVGAATLRVHEMGYEDRPGTEQELANMEQLLRQAMKEGALGVGTSLPYIPATFAPTEELIRLARVAAEYDGMYISHIRDEGDDIFEALEEFLTIVREAGIRGEVYHLKASQKQNYGKLAEVIRRLEEARAEGLEVTADMYTYNASSTGLSYVMPSWVQEGGHEAFVGRLQDPEVRRRLPDEMEMIPPEDILLVSFRNEQLRHLTGKTLAEVAELWETSPEVAAMDLIIQDDSRVGTVRFTMSEDNVRTKVKLPWMSFCSDAGSVAPEPPFTNSQPHPRAYGSFARLLGRYVREEKLIPLEEAIRRLTHFPATNLRLEKRGLLAPGYFADVVVFDPETIADQATFQQPHQLATGVLHLLVNGQLVLQDGQHTGAMPGRFIKGPGFQGKSQGTRGEGE
ncbi:MAG: D-aminoacylase [Deltaproteobacteria bacterium]|nr:D-aminoacylase [Deltaproteobacteria bacterium]